MTPKQASIKAPAEHREERLRSVEAYARGDRNAQIAAAHRRPCERVISGHLLPFRVLVPEESASNGRCGRLGEPINSTESGL